MSKPEKAQWRKRQKADGWIRFASKAEAERFIELSHMELDGRITELRLQPRFKFEVNGRKICGYVADFHYFKDGVEIIEDKKGYKTAEYKIKAELFQALYPQYTFLET
jgi:hypothetical protein